MMEPVTAMAAMSIGGTIGSSLLANRASRTEARALQSAGQLEEYALREQGAATNRMYMFQSAIARENARLELEKGVVEQQTQRMKNAQTLGTFRAQAGASGIDVNTGSKKQVQQDIYDLGELDAATVMWNAGVRSKNFESQATLSAMAGQNALAAANLAAAGSRTRTAAGVAAAGTRGTTSLLSGATSVADRWMQFRNIGAF